MEESHSNSIGSRFRDVLLALKKDRKIKQEGMIAIKTDYSPATISEIKADRQAPSEKILNFMASEYGVNVDYIMTGEGEIYKNQSFIDQRREQKMTIRTLLVPLVPIKARAGYVESHHLDEFIEKLDRFPMAPGINPRGAEWRWFEIAGESMEPTMYEGDYILCSMVPQEDWRNLENYYVYVVITMNAMWVKRIKRRGSNQISMYSDNKKVQPRLVELSEVREIWKVRRHLNARMPPPEKIND